MVGFMMGVAKGMTPSASNKGGKTQLSFAQQLELQKQKSEQAKQLKRTLDPSGPTSAKITAEHGLEGTKYQANKTFQGITEKGKWDVKVKETVDATVLEKNKRAGAKADAAITFKIFSDRNKHNKTIFGRNHDTLPTFEQTLKVMNGDPNTEAFKYFTKMGYFAKKASQKEIKNGLANSSGFIMGKGGPNGGFATLGQREIRDDAIAQYQSDNKHYTTIYKGLSGKDNKGQAHGFFFKENTVTGDYELDRDTSTRSAITTFDRVTNFIMPGINESSDPKKQAALSVKMYIKNRENKEVFVSGGRRLSARQLKKVEDGKIDTANNKGFIQKGKTVSRVENIITAKAQFSAGPGSKRYKTVADQVSKKGSSQDRLYQAVLNKAISVFTNPKEHNRYSGAVNFAEKSTDFAINQIGKGVPLQLVDGIHLVGFAKTHKVNDDSYLQSVFEDSTKVIIPNARELDIIVTTAIGEAEEFSKEGVNGELNINGLDHVLEVIRNRLYHPDFKKQREASKAVKPSLKSKSLTAEEKTVPPGKSLADIARTTRLGDKRDDRIKFIIPKLNKNISYINPSDYEVSELIAAARETANYNEILSNKNLNDAQKAEKIIAVNNTRFQNKVELKQAATLAPIIEKHLLKDSIAVKLNLGQGAETSRINSFTLPRVTTIEKSEKMLLAVVNQSRETVNKLQSLKGNPSRGIANLGRWETWLQTIKNSNIKPSEKKKILDAWETKYSAEIMTNLTAIGSLKTLGPFTRVNIKPENMPYISEMTFKVGNVDISGSKLMQDNFDKLNKFVKFHSEKGIKGDGDDYVFVERIIKTGDSSEDPTITLLIPKSKRTDLSQGRFEVPELKVPNEKGTMVPLTSGSMNPRDNKWIRAFAPEGSFVHPDKEKQKEVNTLLAPFKQALREYKTDKSIENSKILAVSLKEMVGDNGGRLKTLLGDHFNDFKKEDLIMATASVINTAFHSSKVMIPTEINVGGMTNIPITEQNPEHGMRTEKEKTSDLDKKDAQKVRNSAVTVIRYMNGLLNTFMGLGLSRVKANQIGNILSETRMSGPSQELAETLVQKMKDDPSEIKKILDDPEISPSEKTRIENLLGETGSVRTGNVSGVVDWIINKSIQVGAMAEDLTKIETGVMDSAEKMFNTTTTNSVVDRNNLNTVNPQRMLDLKELAQKSKDDYQRALSDRVGTVFRGRTKTERILSARRNFYAIALTYHFAGLVQGGSGGRAISNEDFENLYKALFAGDGDVQYSGIKRALSISQNALYKAQIILDTQGRKGQTEYVLQGVKPLMDAINSLEETEILGLEANKSSRTSNPEGKLQSRRILSTFVSRNNNILSNKGIDQQQILHNKMDKLPFSSMRPIEFNVLASKADIDVVDIQKNITSQDFYKLLDTLAGLEDAERAGNPDVTSFVTDSQNSGSASLIFNNGVKNMLKDSPELIYNPRVKEPPGMNASGKTMYEIFQVAEEVNSKHQEYYRSIKRDFLTAYVRTYVDRVMNNVLLQDEVDESGFTNNSVSISTGQE